MRAFFVECVDLTPKKSFPQEQELNRFCLHLLQRHPALAIPRFAGNRVAGAATAAIAEEHAGPFQIDAFERFAAGAMGRFGGVLLARTAFSTGAEQGFIAFDLDHVSPRHRLAAAAIPRSFADRVAIAPASAGTTVKNIHALTLACGWSHRRGHCRALWCRNATAFSTRFLIAIHRAAAERERQQQYCNRQNQPTSFCHVLPPKWLEYPWTIVTGVSFPERLFKNRYLNRTSRR